MSSFRTAVFAASIFQVAGSFGSAADGFRPVLRDEFGAIPVPFVATNGGAERIACAAALAHWFTLNLGEAAPGESVTATLWFNRRTGEFALKNEAQDRMPVTLLWCGIDGRSWATRSTVPLPRVTGVIPPPIRVACAPGGGKLRCR